MESNKCLDALKVQHYAIFGGWLIKWEEEVLTKCVITPGKMLKLCEILWFKVRVKVTNHKIYFKGVCFYLSIAHVF